MSKPVPPSNHPEFAPFLVQLCIDSISVNPDSFVAVKTVVAAAEKTAHKAPSGPDGFVFTAGIGENCPEARAAICERSAWLGAQLDEAANRRGDAKISLPRSGVAVWVVPTDEEQMIAIHTREAMVPAPRSVAQKAQPALETPR